jgi:tRNA(adenine34) deaminase
MQAALQEAEKALQEGEIAVGAALYCGDTLLWADHNRREQLHDPTAHAEILCLRNGAKVFGDWRLSDCTLYVTLEPCPMCAGALVQARVGRLVYGAANPEQGCAGSLYRVPEDPAFPHFCPCDGGVLGEECRALLDGFFKRQRQDSKA